MKYRNNRLFSMQYMHGEGKMCAQNTSNAKTVHKMGLTVFPLNTVVQALR